MPGEETTSEMRVEKNSGEIGGPSKRPTISGRTVDDHVASSVTPGMYQNSMAVQMQLMTRTSLAIAACSFQLIWFSKGKGWLFLGVTLYSYAQLGVVAWLLHAANRNIQHAWLMKPGSEQHLNFLQRLSFLIDSAVSLAVVLPALTSGAESVKECGPGMVWHLATVHLLSAMWGAVSGLGHSFVLVGEQALFLVCSSVYWWGEIQLSRLGILFCSSALSCIVGSTLAAATQLTHRKGCSVSPVQKFVHGLLPGHIPVSGGVYTSVILYVLIISMDVVPLTRSYTASDGHVPLKFFLIFLGTHAVIKSVRKATQQPSEERAELEKPETVEAPELAGHNDIYVGGALEGVSSVSSLPGGVGKSDDQDDSGGKSQGGKGAGGNRRRRISDNGSMSDSARSNVSGAEGGEAGARSMPRWVEPTSSFEAATSCSSVSSKSSIASSVHRPISPERVNQARVMVRIANARLPPSTSLRSPVNSVASNVSIADIFLMDEIQAYELERSAKGSVRRPLEILQSPRDLSKTLDLTEWTLAEI